jgi:hypothetical protein
MRHQLPSQARTLASTPGSSSAETGAAASARVRSSIASPFVQGVTSAVRLPDRRL